LVGKQEQEETFCNVERIANQPHECVGFSGIFLVPKLAQKSGRPPPPSMSKLFALLQRRQLICKKTVLDVCFSRLNDAEP
jgi:hypothetical protein